MTARRQAVIFSLMGLRNAEGVAEALLHRWDCDLLTWEPATALLSLRNIPHRPLHTIATHKDDPGIHEAIARFERATEAMQHPDFRRAYGHLDDSAWTELQTIMAHALRNDIYVGITITNAVRAAADTHDVRLAIVSEDHMRDNRTLVTVAQSLGIPTMQIIHSVPTGSRMPLEPIATEHVAVFSEHTREQYLRLGARPEGIVITGNPAWDAFVRPPLPNHRTAVCRAMGLDPERPIIMYAITAGADLTATYAAYPRHHLDLAETVLTAFIELSCKHPDWQFLLRPRPGPRDAEPFEAMLGALPEAETRAIILDRNSPYNSLVVSDVVLNTQSNMGIEAILLGKPAINVDIDAVGGAIYREGLGPLFDDDDATLHARTPADIAGCIEAALLDEQTRNLLRQRRRHSQRKFNGLCDGRATERVVDRILHLARVKPGPCHAFFATELALRAKAQDCNRNGETAFEHGNMNEALARFTEAASLYRRDARIMNNLATAAFACGEQDRAWNLILEAFHYDPGSDTVRENIEAMAAATSRTDQGRALLDLFGSIASS